VAAVDMIFLLAQASHTCCFRKVIEKQ